jgi:hypothetical protein
LRSPKSRRSPIQLAQLNLTITKVLLIMATPSISRERSPVAVLVDPKTEIPLGERDIRLEDYLNDKIQTRSDFANVANLLENVETQKRQLDAQVSVGVSIRPLKLILSYSLKKPELSWRHPRKHLRITIP